MKREEFLRQFDFVDGRWQEKVAPASKYRNVKTQVDDLTFDSKKEADRYGELVLLQKAGEIQNLRRQVAYRFQINGVHICSYVADFVYEMDGKTIVEDAKGVRTKEYRLKRQMMRAFFGILILET